MIVFNFNVLARPHDVLAQRVPDPEGIRLWRDLHEMHLGRLAVVVDENVNIERFEHWLKVNLVKAATYEVLDTSDPQLKAEKVQRLMMTVGRGQWYLDNDPAACAATLHMGIPTLVVGSPYIVRPEWAHEKAARPWDAVVEEVDRQNLMRAEKTWGEFYLKEDHE